MSSLHDRSERWFDPKLVKVVESLGRFGELWSTHNAEESRSHVLDIAPETEGSTRAAQVDRICQAFAGIVDAKSSFTYAHSLVVTRAALKIAEKLGLNDERRRLIWRAALLHGIGKLGVSNAILDKPSKLDENEWAAVRRHPLHTQQILERIQPFAELAAVASRHHERLDGTGYPHGLTGKHLSLEARIIAVADVYGALTEDRPYRPGLSGCAALSIMRNDAPRKLDGRCFEALRSV